jgi:hypothetical protein
MNRLIIISLAVLLAVSTANAGKKNRKGGSKSRSSLGSVIANLPVQTIDEAERVDLLFMREEEKLARDVYLELHRTWGLRIFKNIAKSEQKHMDAVLEVLDKYSIPDPAAGNGEGVFSDVTLAALYEMLVAKGKTSVEDALIVGATIEDMDIADLLANIERTDNEDIATVYQNLLRGSRNHLRAFARTMDRYDVPYEAQYISSAEYTAIVTSPKERGSVDADGLRVRNRKGKRQRNSK